MGKYCFRIRFKRSSSTTLNVDRNLISIKIPNHNSKLVLRSRDMNKSIKESTEWVLKGSGFRTFDSAQEFGNKYLDILKVSFAKLRIGVEFGNRSPKSGVTKSGIKFFEIIS